MQMTKRWAILIGCSSLRSLQFSGTNEVLNSISHKNVLVDSIGKDYYLNSLQWSRISDFICPFSSFSNLLFYPIIVTMSRKLFKYFLCSLLLQATRFIISLGAFSLLSKQKYKQSNFVNDYTTVAKFCNVG